MKQQSPIEFLVNQVKKIENENNMVYPNLIGGRDIEKLYGKKLNIDEWTEFHRVYDSK